MEKYIDDLDLNLLCMYQKLSVSFMEKYFKRLNLTTLVEHQDLPESFIWNHRFKLDWNKILLFQKLNESFVYEHRDFVIDKHKVFNNILLSETQQFSNWDIRRITEE